MAKDVVCGMMVDEKTARYKAERGGKAFYFCSGGCLADFTANPTKFVA